MRNTLQIVNIIWKALQISPLKTEISGGIYKHQRPIDSDKEDIIIGCLPITGSQLQEGIVNVNIHVPNLVVNAGSTQDATQPNSIRLEELAAYALVFLQNLVLEVGEVNFSIDNQMVFAEPDVNEHYVNIRLQCYAVNV